MDEHASWTAECFSLANPRGRGQGDVPLLLRRAANSIGELGTVEIQDLVLHAEVNEFGNWPSITIYFLEASQPRSDRQGGHHVPGHCGLAC
jgi:hypothetical protein